MFRATTQKFLLHLSACQRVERRERLVHQKNSRLHGHGPGNGGALFHSTRERVRIAVCKLREMDAFDCVRSPVPCFRLGHCAAGREREDDIFEHGLPGQELIEFLKHKNAIPAGSFNGGAIQPDAALHRLDVTADGF